MPLELIQMLVFWLVGINLTAFVLMGVDKRRARRHAWRVPERVLFLPPFLGGTLGGLLGMHLFHHKTRHWYFRWGIPALLAVQILLGLGILRLLQHG